MYYAGFNIYSKLKKHEIFHQHIVLSVASMNLIVLIFSDEYIFILIT